MKSDNIVPITDLKRDAAGLIEKAADDQSPIIITQNGRATAVLQDIHSYERERNAMAMLSLCLQSERAIAAGQVLTHAEHRKRVDAQLEQLKSRK